MNHYFKIFGLVLTRVTMEGSRGALGGTASPWACLPRDCFRLTSCPFSMTLACLINIESSLLESRRGSPFSTFGDGFLSFCGRVEFVNPLE